jgi:hypothetical protein
LADIPAFSRLGTALNFSQQVAVNDYLDGIEQRFKVSVWSRSIRTYAIVKTEKSALVVSVRVC